MERGSAPAAVRSGAGSRHGRTVPATVEGRCRPLTRASSQRRSSSLRCASIYLAVSRRDGRPGQRGGEAASSIHPRWLYPPHLRLRGRLLERIGVAHADQGVDTIRDAFMGECHPHVLVVASEKAARAMARATTWRSPPTAVAASSSAQRSVANRTWTHSRRSPGAAAAAASAACRYQWWWWRRWARSWAPKDRLLAWVQRLDHAGRHDDPSSPAGDSEGRGLGGGQNQDPVGPAVGSAAVLGAVSPPRLGDPDGSPSQQGGGTDSDCDRGLCSEVKQGTR